MTLPPDPTPLVGRERERSELTHLLTSSPCRLLTIIGPGGMGKTRLAAQVALELQGRFPDGVHWVDLLPVRSAAGLDRAIADALGLSGGATDDPRDHLTDYLAGRRALLLLDNFEHLMDGATLVSDLLRTAPSLQVIVTSREALNLEEEWRYPLLGLPFSSDPSAADPANAAAARLFADRARRFRLDFRLEEELEAVSHICRLVEGSPLALELAAAWTAALPCQEIAREIERSLRFLTSRARNSSARHSSMQAVFDQSWDLLTEEERSAFAALSVFRGGFDRKAALAVTGCSLGVLLALVDKSLLQVEPSGRFRLHELLHQYAADRLAASPEAAGARERHAMHYLRFLHLREADLIEGEQLRAAREIRPELENIRAAWQWAVSERRTGAIAIGIRTLDTFLQLESRYREGVELFGQAAACLESLPPQGDGGAVRVEVLTILGWFSVRLGRIEAADRLFRQAYELHTRLEEPDPGPGNHPLAGLVMVAHSRGDAAEAVRLGEQMLREVEQRGDRHNESAVCYLLTQAYLTLGRLEEAFPCGTRAVAAAEAVGNRWYLAFCLIRLGNVLQATGRTDEARRHYQLSYEIRRAFADVGGMAVARVHLGEVSLEAGRPEEAQSAFVESLALYAETGDKGGLATARCGLGRSAMALGDLGAAGEQLEQALRIAASIEHLPLTLSALAAAGDWLGRAGEPELAVEALSFVKLHPGCAGRLRERVSRILDQLGDQLPAAAFTGALKRGAGAERQRLMEAVRARLALPPDPAPRSAPGPAFHPTGPSGGAPAPERPAKEGLPERLTPRELEILSLIRDGLGNQQIAQRLFMTVGTVKWYSSQIYQKLQVANRTQAVTRARELGLLP
ncbi:MAG: tetratricopeptide repeat protein [Bacillota bacterium]